MSFSWQFTKQWKQMHLEQNGWRLPSFQLAANPFSE